VRIQGLAAKDGPSLRLLLALNEPPEYASSDRVQALDHELSCLDLQAGVVYQPPGLFTGSSSGDGS
jgi:hypothetical protein